MVPIAPGAQDGECSRVTAHGASALSPRTHLRDTARQVVQGPLRNSPRSLSSLCVFLAALSLAASSAAQPRRAPPRRTAPARRAPPPPPPPPPVEDTEPLFAPRRPAPADPFSNSAPPEPVAAPPEAPSDDAHHPLVDVEVQYRLTSRTLTWDADTMRAFRPYNLDVASAARVSGEFYPLRLVTQGALSHLGLTGSFSTAFALDSIDARGRRFETTLYDASLGLRYRLPLRPSLPDVGLSLVWSRQVFFVRASETQALGGVPDLVYDGLRVGASVRFPIVWRLSLRLDAGFTYVGSTGELGDAFLPHATAYALDGAASLAVRLWRGLEARAGFDAKQYNVSANTEPGDRYVATGSSDLYLAGTVGVAWRD